MSDLKPCPFCGGEARLSTWTPTAVSISCIMCGAHFNTYTEAEAIAAWNSRAQTVERTCRNVDKRYSIMFKCSECGHWECQDFDGEKILPQKWNYCPNCGAGVVDA